MFDDILNKIHKKKNPEWEMPPIVDEHSNKKPYVPRLNYTAIKEE